MQMVEINLWQNCSEAPNVISPSPSPSVASLDFGDSHIPAPPTPRSLRPMNSLFSYDPPVPSASLPKVNVPGIQGLMGIRSK